MIKFYDTNVLLSLNDFDSEFFISSVSLMEIEEIKTNKNKAEEVKFAARKISHWLDENTDKYKVVIYTNELDKLILDRKLDLTPDNKIMACCLYLKENVTDGVTFYTNDICCKNIAYHCFGLNIESTLHDYDDSYDGTLSVVMGDDEMAELYENPNVNRYGLHTNQYLIISNADGEVVDKLRWDGETHQPVKIGTIKSDQFGVIKPYKGDIYQQCALNSLCTNQLTMLKGKAGTGKSYLAIGYLFYLLEKHKIDKIVVFTNTQPTINAAKLGFYPGSRTEKILESNIGNMLSSKLGDSFMVERLISEGKLLLLPMCDVRGFDTTGMNCGVYITEAQNMDISLMKLALQRIGEDSICIIDGDYNTQVDLPIFAGMNNGMRRMSEVFRGQDFYGEVELKNIYRSRIAQVADLM